MIQRFLTDTTSASLARALDGYALRQRVIANNIANAETPGFTRSAVSFESQLRAVLEDGDSGKTVDEINNVAISSSEDDTNPAKPDGNNVNMEQEMAEMTKAGLSYRAATTLIELKGSMLKTAINGR